MAENYGTLEGTLDEHGVLSGEMSDRATLDGEIQFSGGGGGVLDVFQNGQSVVEGRKAYVTVPTLLRELRSDDYHNTVTALEMQIWNGKADPSDIPENITDLSDVAVDNIQNGQILKWDATQEKFVNADESGGGSGDVADVKVNGQSVVDPVTKEAEIDLSGYAETSDIPTDLADLNDDATHRLVTDTEKSTWDNKADVSDIPTVNNPTITIQKNEQNVDTFTLNQTSNKVIDISVPTKTSDLQNDSSFITNTVNNLANYYLKSQTYTQAEVDALIDAAVNGRFRKVTVLPATGEPNIIYLVPKATPETSNACDEYIWQDNAWELIGSTDIDLSGYVTDEDLGIALADYLTISAFNTAIANYYTKTEVGNLLDGKVDKINGKGLSTNDYDNTAKGIVDGVTNALAGKVDKVNGKGLSTEDYTTTEKNKLAGISTNANKVEASTTNGNIKIDGTETQVYDDSEIQDKIDETTTSISGNPISISGLKSNQLAVNPVITLEPIQAGSGTPSPSNIRAISGYDKIEALSCGKNFFNAFFKKALNYWGASYTYDSNTDSYTITNIGTAYSNPYEFLENPKYLSLSAVSITNLGTGTNWSIQVRDENANSWRSITSAQLSYDNIYGNKIRLNYSTIGNGATFTKVQLEESASATTYVPYVKTTDLSESLGQTVYGLTHEVRTGKARVTLKELDLGDLTWNYNNGYFYSSMPSDSDAVQAGGIDLYSEMYKVHRSSSATMPDFAVTANNNNFGSNKSVFIKDSRYTDATSFKTAVTGSKLVYKLATPTEIQLIPHEISLLSNYAYVSTNGTNIALDYHNGELASLADVGQLGETVNELGELTIKHKRITWSISSVTANTRYTYSLTENIPSLNRNTIKGITMYAAQGSMAIDSEGIYNQNFGASQPNNVYLQYVAKTTQNSVAVTADILYLG